MANPFYMTCNAIYKLKKYGILFGPPWYVTEGNMGGHISRWPYSCSCVCVSPIYSSHLAVLTRRRNFREFSYSYPLIQQ